MIDRFKQLIWSQGRQCQCATYLDHERRMKEGRHA